VYVPMGSGRPRFTNITWKPKYLDKNLESRLRAKLQALRSCAAAPHFALLHHVEGSEKYGFRSDSDYNPQGGGGADADRADYPERASR